MIMDLSCNWQIRWPIIVYDPLYYIAEIMEFQYLNLWIRFCEFIQFLKELNLLYVEICFFFQWFVFFILFWYICDFNYYICFRYFVLIEIVDWEVCCGGLIKFGFVPIYENWAFWYFEIKKRKKNEDKGLGKSSYT